MSKSKENYKSKMGTKVDKNALSDREKFLLNDSKYFCVMPWTHLHAYPNGAAYPCCLAKHEYPIGSMKDNTLEELWNAPDMKEIRTNMLNEKPSKQCEKCYEQESFGWNSMRESSNVRYGHHVDKAAKTKEDGTYDDVNMIYWDIRFSNLCNLSCRTCGTWFSSNWYDDQVRLWGDPGHDKVTYAGTTKLDAYEQLIEYLPMVEQIYFAGGEPLIMEEHYKILQALIDMGKADSVRLLYNTNFTRQAYKKMNVFDIWPEFKDVSVGASLDAMGPRAELMRNGTLWSDVERNREDMLKKCPDVDFYISPTVGIFNYSHIIDFHNDWIAKGFLGHSDINVNMVQDPVHYRIDVLPQHLKDRVAPKYKEHIEKIRPHDHLGRATGGFEAALNMMMAEDRSNLIPVFKRITGQLDSLRGQETHETFPELTEVLID